MHKNEVVAANGNVNAEDYTTTGLREPSRSVKARPTEILYEEEGSVGGRATHSLMRADAGFPL